MMELNERTSQRNKIDLTFEIINKGNWNLKFPSEPPVFTKPMGVVYYNNGFNYIYTHNELIKLIKFYCEVDEVSIKMIENPDIDTGVVKQKEKTLKDKILLELNEIMYSI